MKDQPSWPGWVLPPSAILLALWSLLPLGVPWDNLELAYYSRAWQTWGWGTVVAGLAAVLLLVLSRGRIIDGLLSLWRRVMAVPSHIFVPVVVLLFAALSVLFTLIVFSGNPRNVDGFAQLFQARIFHAGRLWVAPPEQLASFATLQMILGPDRWYSQYPPGQSLVLAGGLSLGAWWLLNPLIAAWFAFVTFRVARWCTGEETARLTLLLLCISPFVVAVAGSEMSHLSAACIGMSAAAAAAAATERRTALYAALAGLLLGVMTAFRPLDAIAAAAPVAVILWFWTPRRWLALVATGLAGILGTIPTMWFNSHTTGHFYRFGYTELWGSQHSLGFHPVPFGIPLTLTRAVARSGIDLHQLNMYLFDSTIPVLVIVAAGYWAGRKLLQPRDTVPFVGVLSLVTLLFFYWHRDTFYGPRFLFSAVAWFVILLAGALALLRRSSVVGDATRTEPRPLPAFGKTATFFALAAMLTGLVMIGPGRINAYRRSTPDFNLHPDRDARRYGIHHAVVVIPDGWGSRLIARMWQAGIPVKRSSRIYATIDACTLEGALAAAETTSTEGHTSLPMVLDSLIIEHQEGVPANVTSDPNLRLRPDVPLAPECRTEIEVDRRGFYQYGPYLWLNNASLDGDVVWARDLGPRNAALFQHYAGRRFYRYAPDANRNPILIPIDGPGW